MTVLHLDFETRSTADLKKVGAYAYSEDPNTDVWCLAYAFDEEPIHIWQPGMYVPDDVDAHIEQGGMCVAHNAAFERAIFANIMQPRYDFPVPHLRQWRCTMAMAYAMSLPGALEKAAPAMGLDVEKDMVGHRLMLKMCRPRRIEPDGTIIWWDEPENVQRLIEYCKKDVEVERRLMERLVPLRRAEQQVWFMDQEINDRGVYIDEELCNRAMLHVERDKARITQEMKRITGGTGPSEVSQLVKWLNANGLETDTINADAIKEFLGGWDLPDDIRRVLELRQAYAKTSVAKIGKMLDMRCRDGRVRGNLQYHGAGPGRWAARGVQMQNLTRPKIKDVGGVINLLMEMDWRDESSTEFLELMYGQPIHAISDCIRGMIAAERSNDLISSDLSNIEGRKAAWFAGQEDKLEAFRAYDRGEGPDLYLVAAGGIFGLEPAAAKPHRQIGKVAELSLGYQGGFNAFVAMAANYDLKIGDHFDVIWPAAQEEHKDVVLEAWDKWGKKRGVDREAWLAAEVVKTGWRRKNDRIVATWANLEDAALQAVLNPGKVYATHKVKYRMAGSFLWCQLPSERCICYPYAKTQTVKTPWGAEKLAIVCKSLNSTTNRWEEKTLYGGLLFENICQGSARDVLVAGMLNVRAAGYPIILTVHDEIISEKPKDFGSLDEFNALMTDLPPWAEGLPVSVDGWVGERYRK